MTHTPGPWKFDEYGDFIFAIDKDGNPFPVADVRGWGHLPTEYGEKKAVEIQIANAQLIAAAPDMKDWIKETISNLNLYDDEGIFTVIIASGKALLKRIEGDDDE